MEMAMLSLSAAFFANHQTGGVQGPIQPFGYLVARKPAVRTLYLQWYLVNGCIVNFAPFRTRFI